LREVAGEAGSYAEEGDLTGAVARVLTDRARYVSAGLERARRFSWEQTARLTADVYRKVLV
jgi:glycosyltransferase involved in cell wall biosynthesis